MPIPSTVVIPEGKPYYEWARGTLHQKMSPSLEHSRLQTKIGALLLAWGEELGVVATEWDMDVTPELGDTRRYLPDVGFTSFTALAAAGQLGAAIPEISPDLAIEILSPRDNTPYLADKIAAYLVAGSRAVIVVDPMQRCFCVHRARSLDRLAAGDAFTDDAFPGLRLDVGAIFGILDRGAWPPPRSSAEN
ncbi:MAG: Uma2 family endonuclease [Candidatus Velthaea sp.]